MNTGLLAFSLIALFLVLSPGVNTMLIINNASNFGRKTTTFNIAGLCSATFFHGALSLFGISVIVLSSPRLYLVVKSIGGLYLAYIGTKMLWSGAGILRGKLCEKAVRKTVSSSKSSVESFREGFITQLFNPKVSMFYLAAFPQFIAGRNTVFEGFSLVLIHASIIASWFFFLTFFISRMKQKIEDVKVQAAINIVTGTVLLFFAAVALIW
ncbi:threonine/homoserine/homoserine lactone efflux protein [Variovorax sp. GrIS 2.14]|uniref:LysE family translocator n=1 Tax=Variovorax sp. GrIS 2.14 TaxID=3071709 RepID=UPI0038F731AC